MITAKIIADSISADSGARVTTFELEYPRFIHAEFMTHRLFSRNAASSRAIPVASAIKLILENTAMPVHWGKNQPGMSAKEECNEHMDLGSVKLPRRNAWFAARDRAIFMAEAFNKAGYHKQIVNRLLEPFSHIKVVCTATTYENFFYLRCHKDAQPEIQELASKMFALYEASVPKSLKKGEWHVPYFRDGFWTPQNEDDSLEDALAVSASCCAQVSYRKLDDSVEKARNIFDRLVESKPVHASPFEHQATPMIESRFREDEQVLLYFLEEAEGERGITHVDVHGNVWSANFCGWVQHRQLINDNTCWSYEP